ncbi:MAG: hypothetical protein A2666_03835 [Parcubacteria group bacterium RIFCSPHIGHO2_01_FULL_47_10b]|nr:MAG: hypothetical protein A2666_03835 [Parcubacteria group bacterium RIFCSPHIGHO2_01_FULL_47_10b]
MKLLTVSYLCGNIALSYDSLCRHWCDRRKEDFVETLKKFEGVIFGWLLILGGAVLCLATGQAEWAIEWGTRIAIIGFLIVLPSALILVGDEEDARLGRKEAS